MFTGLVSAIGTVRAVRRSPHGLAIEIAAPWRQVRAGESVAVDGVCLTVVRAGRGRFAVQAIGPTRGRTKLDAYRPGVRVNLERALRPADRLGGHFVTGHVDGVGRIAAVREAGDSRLLDLRVPAAVRALCVPHGSIAVDGVSLTINAMPGADRVQVALIPHTRRATTLGGARVGERVHLEADLIGKYVKQLMRERRAGGRRRS